MYKHLLVTALVLLALQSLGGEQLPETSAPKRVNAARGFRPQIRGGLHRAAADAQSGNLPPIVKQFEETSYYLKDIAMLDANTGWAVGEPYWDPTAKQYKGTIIKTTNSGTAWTAQDAGVVETFSGLRFVDANQGWVVGANGAILHTRDGGDHWVKQAVATTDEFRGVAFTDAKAGWATSIRPVHHDPFGDEDDWQAGIWHTADGGNTWLQQQLPANASLLNRIDFVDAQTGWAVGAKFTGYRAGGFPQHVGAIYQTSDGGRTWSEQYSPELPMTFTAVDFVDANTGWVTGFATESTVQGGAMFHTVDGGKTWSRQITSAFCAGVLWDIQFVDRNRGYAVGADYISAWGAPVCRTTDGGATWTPILMQKHASNPNDGLYGVAVVGNQVIAVGDHDFTVWSTTAWDPGKDAQPSCFNNACLFSQRYLSTHYTFYDAFFLDKNRGWVVGTRTYSPVLWGQVILHTDDGGASWKTQYEHAPPADSLFSYHRLDKVYFTDSQNGWAVGASEYGDDRKPHGGILHTTDGGSTWKEQGTELYASWNIEFSAVQFLNSREGWALADGNFPSENVFLAHTTDGGNHWYFVDTGIKGEVAVGFGMVQGGMLFRDPQHGWLAAWDVLLSTSDGGAHWIQQKLGCINDLYILCVSSKNGIAFTDSQNGWIAGEGLFRTTDGGAHWSVAIKKFEGWYHGIQFLDSRNGWLAGDYGELRYTNDGGANWQLLDSTTGEALQGLHFVDPQHGWIVGAYGTILSYAGDRTPSGQPGIFSVVNGASYRPGIAAGVLLTISGTNLSRSTRAWSSADFVGGKLPTQLDGVRVNINGSPAYVCYISPSQINALAGADSSEGLVPVQVVSAGGTSDPFGTQKASYAPGLFTWPPGLITTWTTQSSDDIVAQAADGTWIGDFELMYAVHLEAKMRDAKPGEIITLYGTGFGATTPPTPVDSVVAQPAKLAAGVTFRFGRTVAEVVWAGQIGSGVYQFNIKVPDVASGFHVVAAEIGGHRSQGNAVISVQQQ